MPVRNERAFIGRSLGSVLAQDYPTNRIEVFVADGLSTDGTPDIVRGFQQRHPNVHLLENPGKIVATGLNETVARARGDIVVRVDGHCEIAPDYVSRCVDHLERREAEGVGGFIETVGENLLSRVIALAMSSSFGVGGALFRTTSGKTCLVDTVAFPAYTREAIERAGPFDEELVRNQDDEYNYRLRRLGFRILLAADVRSRYYSRSSLRSLWRQYFQYGYWKVRVMQKHPRQMRLRQFVPLAFVAYLLGSTLVAPLTPLHWVPLATGASAYVGINLAASIWIARREIWRAFPLLSVAFATLHLSYGLGFLTGLARFACRWGDRNTRTTSSFGQSESVTGSPLLPPEESLR
jgi:glycosyltransferase involved in cell wall biosynthesis